MHNQQTDRRNEPGAAFVSNFIALAICMMAFALWAKILIDKYLRFGYYDWDLAFFSQAMWNLMHSGSAYSSLFGVNLFGNHSNFIAYLVLPIYALVPHPMTLVFLKVASYVGAAFVLYLIAKEKLGWSPAIIFMFLYLIYPPNIFSVIYEFDFESLSPVFLFLLFYFFKKERFLPFLIMAVITISVKENMPLIVAAFGLYGIFSRRNKKILWGIVPLILGMASFYLLISLIIPSFSTSGTYGYLGHYSRLGNSPIEITKTIFLDPLTTLKSLFDTSRLKFISELFSPLWYLSFLSPHIVFLGFPIILQHLLSVAYQEHTIYFQYGISIAPFIFLATVDFLAVIVRPKMRNFTFYIFLGMLLLFNVLSTRHYTNAVVERLYPHVDNLDAARWELIKKIPKQAPVIATFDFLAELSTRKSLYSFHKMYSDCYRGFTLPEEVTYALIDLRDPWLQAELRADYDNVSRRINDFLSSDDWFTEAHVGNILLLIKKENTKPNAKKG